MSMKMLGLIPARGCSKGIPRKNIKPFLGKPLLAWTVEEARESGVFERLVLSTDDEEIAQTGKACGAEIPFLRPAELADDTTLTAPVAHHAVQYLRDREGWVADFVMVLEPTSPTRRAFHIREAADLLRASGADAVASVCAVPHHYVPMKLLTLRENGTISGLDGIPVGAMVHRRQELPTLYAFDGLIFSCQARWVLSDPPSLWGNVVRAYVVDPKYRTDLDRLEDWEPAEARLKRILEEEGAVYGR